MIGSVASVKGFPRFGVYTASKAAFRSFARTWLNELKDRKIRVNVLSPGEVRHTDSSDSTGDEGEFESLIPRGEMGRPRGNCHGRTVSCFRRSSYVNGVGFAVDSSFSAI